MAGSFYISQEVERLNARWIKCDEVMKKSRGLWNDAAANYFMSEYWGEFERTVPDMNAFLSRLDDFLKSLVAEI